MKRYRIANKFRFITSMVIVMLLGFAIMTAFLGFGRATASDKRSFVTVRVEQGDTLWDLASAYGPGNYDIRRVVYEIEQINNVSASTLQPGQLITIPTDKL